MPGGEEELEGGTQGTKFLASFMACLCAESPGKEIASKQAEQGRVGQSWT